MCHVCRDLNTLPLGVIDRLWSMIVSLPGHFHNYICRTSVNMGDLGVLFSVRSSGYLYPP